MVVALTGRSAWRLWKRAGSAVLELHTRAVRVGACSGAAMDRLEGADPEQRVLMEEQVICVDRNDQVLGPDSKKRTHLAEHGPILHRAFSVFLFNKDHEMLLQQRASVKVTFADYWTNTCCSHPLYVEEELAPGGDTLLGVKNAAIRKLQHELGIPCHTFTPDDFHFLTRIHYRALSDCGEWGEHEIDYVLFAKRDEVVIEPQPNEVRGIKYVTPDQLRDMFEQEHQNQIKLTPWFKHIMNRFGFEWWDAFKAGKLATHLHDQTIHRFVSDD
ncbi:Isopentenyl-diphosphate Delta-isomerase I [Porphyridium purpureum]|uniref:isopentenyl-diphosphate Delta-isomerase n=1 Tax=Porphyridium purpureum TaxID=35688 RepID=A0A5J4Z265_PORPP|nr:Isopentenyl-diphosphate Delta-isomerase I [Porphyridium purpureum]|eukprot:POR4170..scf295_1